MKKWFYDESNNNTIHSTLNCHRLYAYILKRGSIHSLLCIQYTIFTIHIVIQTDFKKN